MQDIIKIDDEEYPIEALNDEAKLTIESLKFVDNRIEELQNMSALLQRAKNGYIDTLKQEVLSKKAGFLFEED